MIYQHHCGRLITIEEWPGTSQIYHFYNLSKETKITNCPQCKRHLFQTDVDTSLLKKVEE